MNSSQNSRLKKLESKSKQMEPVVLIFHAVDKDSVNFSDGYKCIENVKGKNFYFNGILMKDEELEGRRIIVDNIR